jgi:ribosome recycling factor
VEHVVRLLRIADNDLPSVESRHQILTQEVKSMESEKRNSIRIFQDLTDQITHLHKISEDCQSACKKEMDKMDSLYHKLWLNFHYSLSRSWIM